MIQNIVHKLHVLFMRAMMSQGFAAALSMQIQSVIYANQISGNLYESIWLLVGCRISLIGNRIFNYRDVK